MTQVLELTNLKLSLGDHCLVHIDTHINGGDILTVMGPSGIGKTTLLNAVAGFLDPSFKLEGQIMINGFDVTHLRPEKRHVGLIFQDPLLFPHMSVMENLLFALPKSNNSNSRVSRRQTVEQALETVGLGGFAERDPATLSGGQQSRVALLRTLLSEPSAILMDEPFGKLDLDLRREIRHLTFSSIRDAEIPAILVTHDLDDARAAGSHIVRLAT